MKQKIEYIRRNLIDEESRQLFDNRVKYYYERDIIDLMKNVQITFEYTQSEYKKQRTIDKFVIGYDHSLPQFNIVFGNGRVAKEVRDVLEQAKIPVHLQSEDTSTISYEYVNKEKEMVVNVIVAVETNNFSSIIKLKKLGVNTNDLILLRRRELQYFGRPFLNQDSNEIFIDAGAMNGETLLFFRNWNKGRYKKIYSFEPDPKNYALLLETICREKISNVVPLNIGLYSQKSELSFDMQGTASSSVKEDGNIVVKVDKLDNIIDDEKVSFIKMDIEGAELEALKGSERIIRNNTPKLAICVYHKPEDIIEIPFFVLSLNPTYKLAIRHHSWGRNETILYAFK